jgi:tetratricopeptide (TPR) repeat protein
MRNRTCTADAGNGCRTQNGSKRSMTGLRMLAGFFGAAIFGMVALPGSVPVGLAQSSQSAVDAAATAVKAAQMLFEAGQFQTARDLLQPYVNDGRAALIYVRSGLALKVAGAQDIALMQAQSATSSGAARVLGDLYRAGAATGGTPDFVAAEAAYRQALDMGDKASELRLAQMLAQAGRYPEAIAAYQALLDDYPEQEPRYVALAVTRGGITDPAELMPLLERLDVLSETNPLAARTAASVFERGTGVEKDPARAVFYAKRAVALGVTDIGVDAAACETCSMLDVVTLLKGTSKLDPENTAATLERALAVGLYAESYEIFMRFEPPVREQMLERFVTRFSAVSNPVVGFTQAMLASAGGYGGAVDGQLGPETLRAVGSFARGHGIAVTQFDAPLVSALFDKAG